MNGTYYSTYTSTSPIMDCQYVTYSVDENGRLTGLTGWPGCCMSLTDFDTTSDPMQVHYKISRVSGTCTVTGTADITSKFITTVGSGDSLCMIYTSCRTGRIGIYVVCRQKNNPQSLLGQVILALTNLINPLVLFLYGLPNLQAVNQGNCIFPDNNYCPA